MRSVECYKKSMPGTMKSRYNKYWRFGIRLVYKWLENRSNQCLVDRVNLFETKAGQPAIIIIKFDYLYNSYAYLLCAKIWLLIFVLKNKKNHLVDFVQI